MQVEFAVGQPVTARLGPHFGLLGLPDEGPGARWVAKSYSGLAFGDVLLSSGHCYRDRPAGRKDGFVHHGKR
jgi:hypothetical protein